MKNISACFLMAALVLLCSISNAQQALISDTSAIRYESFDRFNSTYATGLNYNSKVERDGAYLIYELKKTDTVAVGRFTYREGFLVDSGVINTDKFKLRAFFVHDDQLSKSIYIPEISENAVPQGLLVREYYVSMHPTKFRVETYDHGFKNGKSEFYFNRSYYTESFIRSYVRDTLQGFSMNLTNGRDTSYAGMYVKGEKNGWWTASHRNEKEYYSAGKLKTRKLYNPNGTLTEEESWDADSGLYFKEYFSNGRLYHSCYYDERRALHGKDEYFYDNGNRELTTTYIHGIEEGLAQGWYENGVLRYRITYQDNMREGKAESFYESGKPFRVFYCHLDSYDGVYKEWSPGGKLQVHIIYKNGRAIKTILAEPEPSGPSEVMEGPMGVDEEMEAGPNFYKPVDNELYEYNANPTTDKIMRWVKAGTLTGIQEWNTFYASLKKKEKKKWTSKEIRVTLYMIGGGIESISLNGIPEEYQQELKRLFVKSCTLKSSVYPGYYQGRVIITIPCTTIK